MAKTFAPAGLATSVALLWAATTENEIAGIIIMCILAASVPNIISNVLMYMNAKEERELFRAIINDHHRTMSTMTQYYTADTRIVVHDKKMEK